MDSRRSTRSHSGSIDTFNSRKSFTFSSTDRPSRPESPAQMSPAFHNSRRSGSYHSNHSRKSSEDRRRYDNTVYHYGRHSNYWLFGGFSVRDTVRDGVDWVRQHGKKS
ncbi:hypothetical protein P175DRAFT_0503206 [Aspergillus ochraceoroseus IBT 24754]|uniref:Uncharacterized protein n=3 Tax=Aspergillus subgen. Nidulantes TaxID=2720870 RepID=A0A0F8UWF6_9EURO|nr:uncharacterized protein P175DRAFT_0503206 [Aspergillus ochraceoroseus IBT 24754]KKK16179.1 hypothetical protein AOCH_007767 [Aspergillus ochraceoroseus]KKK23829.1 hypothetical protein ARAM_004529 [Aspergillus rambellii]PTU19665.1 hypothetical protein P175DRAFT_0503206 [Aspergillus ochraceoroseus IBT 24754]